MKISVTDFSTSIGASVFKLCVHLRVCNMARCSSKSDEVSLISRGSLYA